MATSAIDETSDDHSLQPEIVIEPIPPTDYSAFVADILKTDSLVESSEASSSSSKQQSTIDQRTLRQCLNLASSFLVADMATRSEGGINTWSSGLNSLVDLLIVLHNRHELEVDTVSAASRACHECWTVAGNWRGMDDCRQRVREVGLKLRRILDPNERTYGGERVYAP